MASRHITSWQIEGRKLEAGTEFLFLGSKITADSDCSHEIRRHLLLGRKGMTNLDSVLKSRDITLVTKVHKVKAMVFPLVTYHCGSWTVKKAERKRINAFELCCWSPLDSKEIKPVNLKRDQLWSDAEAEMPVFWSSDVNSWLIGKVPDTGKDWWQKRVSEDEMAGWHHQCNEHELGQTSGDGEGQGGLMCCSPWSCKELDTTGQLNGNSNPYK